MGPDLTLAILGLLRDIVLLLTGLFTGYMLHAIVAMEVFPPYKKFFWRYKEDGTKPNTEQPPGPSD